MRTIAVIGFSHNKERPSNFVSKYMEKQGYEIIPVNPNHLFIENKKCFSTLKDIEKKIDIVNIFRKPEYVLPIVEHAIKLKVKAIWMQDNVWHKEAARIADEAGLLVVMNDCLMRRHIKKSE